MKAVRLYAQVLVDVIAAPGAQHEGVMAELNEFAKSLKGAPAFTRSFDNPTLSDDEKQKTLADVVKKIGMSELSARFLSLVARRSRMSVLSEILKEVETIQIERRGGLIGEIVSAIPLEAGVVTGIQEALGKRLHKPIQLKQKVDAGLIAGMRVTVNGVTYDGTVRGKLDKLAGSLN